MPRLPFGLGRDFLQRLRNELGGGAPRDLTPGESRDDEGFINLLDRAVNLVRRDKGEVRGPVQRPPPSSVGDVMARIQEAGRNHVLLLANYAAAHGHGPTWRYLGPYSYRYRDKDDPAIPLFYAHCYIHGHSEAFKLKRFLDIQVTALPFADAKFKVEF